MESKRLFRNSDTGSSRSPKAGLSRLRGTVSQNRSPGARKRAHQPPSHASAGSSDIASKTRSEVTRLVLHPAARAVTETDRLFQIVYQELRELAVRMFRREQPDQTLQATALVHETYLKLIDQDRVDWHGRGHFLAVAAQAMRRILLDRARRRAAHKRGGSWKRISLDDKLLVGWEADDGIIALDGAIERLAQCDPRQAQLVELRFFGGLNVEETAYALGISKRTVEREWTMVRAWLRRELGKNTA